MSFGHPWLLLLVAVPVLLMVWEAVRRGMRLAVPFDHSRQPDRRGWQALLWFAEVLPAVLLGIVVAILAAPLVFDEEKQERKLTNVELVVDISGSMNSRFGEGSRYDAAMEAIKYFTNRRRGDAFGLTIFGGEVLRWTPLTKDVAAIRNATPFLKPELMPHAITGGTRIGKAVMFCRKTLTERGEGDRMIVLLSDGRSSDLGTNRARKIGTELADDQIVVHAIHIGDAAAPNDLYELTQPTGGQVFAADQPGSLMGIFDDIDRMKPVEMKSAERRQVFLYQPFILAALIVLGLYVTSLFGLRYTPW
ncbi:MAG: VWA domain-containing protein [Planctomycetales bacterium]